MIWVRGSVWKKWKKGTRSGNNVRNGLFERIARGKNRSTHAADGVGEKDAFGATEKKRRETTGRWREETGRNNSRRKGEERGTWKACEESIGQPLKSLSTDSSMSCSHS